MTTAEDLLGYLRRARGRDVAVAVAALLGTADPDGRADRKRWRADVERIGSGGPGGAAAPPASADVERVLNRLEADGVAVREPAGAEWRSVRFEEELWAAIRPHRQAVHASVERTLQAPAETGDGGGGASAPTGTGTVDRPLASVAPAGEGSRLWAEGLTKVYKNRAVVNDVDISVEQGEIVGLLGPNGAGKTTTFYMIVGLIPPNAGRVYLDDDEITKVPMYQRARRGIGYLAQEPSIFRRLTVEQNVRAILETLDIPKKERKARLEELLDELSIAHLRDSVAYSLSGGERRRLEITRALVQRPKFMLLDEPFAGIDPIATSDIQQIVRDLKNRTIGVIISDHNVEQTLEIVDRAYIMYEGRIRVGGTVSELVWNDEVAEIYLGPTLTERMRHRYAEPRAPRVKATERQV